MTGRQWTFNDQHFEYELLLDDFSFPWAGHKKFGYDLVANLNPNIVVELGTYCGTSLWSFSQAAKDFSLETKLYAIDTWKGEQHSGFYGEDIYEKVNEIKRCYYKKQNITLIREEFDKAQRRFENKTIDILHIDGLHTYSAVKHDFENWLPKVKDNGVILFHDIKVSHNDFGVYLLWNDLKKKYDSLEFHHSYGLGVIFLDRCLGDLFFSQNKNLQMYYYYAYETAKNNKFFTLNDVIYKKDVDLNEQNLIIQNKSVELNNKNTEIEHQNRIILQKDGELYNQSQVIAQKETELHDQSQIIAEKNTELYNQSQVIAQKNIELQNQSHIIQQRDFVIEEMRKSKFWKIRDHYWKIKIELLEKKQCLKRTLLRCFSFFRKEDLVSVIIPVYDRVEELRESLDSILNQTYKNIEIIIVTDGSPKETEDVLEFYKEHFPSRVKVFYYLDNTGNAVRGRNKGILESTGKYIAFQDSDDVALEDRIEKSVYHLENNKVDVVYGGWEALVDGTRKDTGLQNGERVLSPDCTFEDLLNTCIPCQSTVMVKREALLDVGGLKFSMKYREDHELWVRLAYFGYKFKAIPDVIEKLRIHKGNNELNFKEEDSHWESNMRKEYTNKQDLQFLFQKMR